MKYADKRFTVAQSGTKEPTTCRHGWFDVRERCMFCGAKLDDLLHETEDRAREVERRMIADLGRSS